MKKFNIILFLLAALAITSCGRKYSDKDIDYISSIKKMRQDKDNQFANSPESPFNYKGKVHFENLKYYEVDPDYVFHSRLTEYEKKDTVTVFGTKGEERKAVRYGFITFHYDNKDYKLNVYKGFTKSGEEYFSIWFTDKTTGEETYGVGRYLDFELNPNKDFLYTIDFNQAYNPYCSYSPEYSCAIPTKEDHIDIAIKAGEKRFH